MRALLRAGWLALVLVVPQGVWAQADDLFEDDVSDEDILGDESEDLEEEEEEYVLPDIGQDQLANFVLDRGLYTSSDVGIFLSFAGRKGVSNVMPYLAIHTGYDINDELSAQLSFAFGYVSGNAVRSIDNPLDPAAIGVGSRLIDNYDVMNIGADVVYAFRPTQRFAIEAKVGGGMTRFNPAPSLETNPAEADTPFGAHVAFGADFKYLTLMTNFTAGASITGYFILPYGVPAVAVGGVVRYTFGEEG